MRQKTQEKRGAAGKTFTLPDVQDLRHPRVQHAAHTRTKSFKIDPAAALQQHFGPLSPQASSKKTMDWTLQQSQQFKAGHPTSTKMSDSYVAIKSPKADKAARDIFENLVSPKANKRNSKHEFNELESLASKATAASSEKKTKKSKESSHVDATEEMLNRWY